MHCSMPGFLSLTISWCLPKFKSIESVVPSNHLTPCHPLLLLPSVFPSIVVFSNESAVHIGGQSIAASALALSFQEYLRLISLKIDSFVPLAVQGALKSLFQHHSFVGKQLYSNNQKITIFPKWITILPADTVITCHEAQGRKF